MCSLSEITSTVQNTESVSQLLLLYLILSLCLVAESISRINTNCDVEPPVTTVAPSNKCGSVLHENTSHVPPEGWTMCVLDIRLPEHQGYKHRPCRDLLQGLPG